MREFNDIEIEYIPKTVSYDLTYREVIAACIAFNNQEDKSDAIRIKDRSFGDVVDDIHRSNPWSNQSSTIKAYDHARIHNMKVAMKRGPRLLS